MEKLIPIILVFHVIGLFIGTPATAQLLTSKNDDPELKLSMENFTKKYGYQMETHEVTTEDGYFLTIFRVLGDGSSTKKKKPILLFHGIQGQSENFLINARNNGSLAFFLVDNNYDVWLGNTRGTMHGRKHKYLTPENKEFWNFSLHEIAVYDLTSITDYILQLTNYGKISYIGHSQGGVIYLILCSVRPEYQQKFMIASLLGSTGILNHYTNPLFLVLLKVYKNQEILRELANTWAELPPTNVMKISDFCQLFDFLCMKTMLFIAGNQSNIDESIFPLVFQYMPSVATKQFLHFAQMIDSNHFRPYDYGKEENMRIYGKSEPDDYPIQNIEVPIAFYYSGGDHVIFAKNVEETCSIIRNCVRKFMVSKTWNHLDLIAAKNVTNVLFKKIVKFSQEYEN